MLTLLLACAALIGSSCSVDDLARHKMELGIDHLTECWSTGQDRSHKVCGDLVTSKCATVPMFAGSHPYDIEAIERGIVALAVGRSCQGLLDSCGRIQLAFGQNIAAMKADILLGCLKKRRDFKLRQPC